MGTKVLNDLEGRIIEMVMDMRSASLVIKEDNGDSHRVCLPIKVDNEFELIPYHMALFNQLVSYRKEETVEHHCGLTDYTRHKVKFTLNVLSGPLKGNSYTATKRP